MAKRAPAKSHQRAKNRQVLTQAMEEYKARTGLEWEDLAKRARISTTWLRTIRNNVDRAVTPDVAARLDDAFGWRPGSVMAAVEEGTPPQPAEDGDGVDRGPGSTRDSVVAIVEYWGKRCGFTAGDYGQFAADLARIRQEGYEAGLTRARRRE